MASQGQAKGQPGPGQGPARARPRASHGAGHGPAMHYGPCPAMNEHPRRDTDVILSLSKVTIEDLSFYIGFVQESIVDMVAVDETMAFV